LTGILLTATAGIALATGTLDQQNPGPTNQSIGTCEGGDAQTFTAGLSGSLDTVELVAGDSNESGDLVVTIEGTDSLANPGVPDDSDVLATETIATADIASYGSVQTIVFGDPAAVEAGTKYAIVIKAPGCVQDQYNNNGFSFAAVSGNPYSAGQGCYIVTVDWQCDVDKDFVFATYVTQPESADVAVSVSGPGTVRSGSTNTYQVTVSNSGPMTARNVVLTVPVPAGTRFVSAIPTHGTCAAPARRTSPPTVTCALGDLSAAGSVLTTVTLKVALSAKGGAVVTVAQAYSTATNSTPATTDPDLSNNVDSVGTTVTK
jgi:uncharacterized repeat protein (TIGR01451 family)